MDTRVNQLENVSIAYVPHFKYLSSAVLRTHLKCLKALRSIEC